ncbi:MAG: cobalt/nickel transport protein [Candidatus Petromonas sp.]|jgi:cobalt/nickel transport protein|nr:cobalt/nickel transport protein [Candidatus Petromonas sp.]
MVKQNMILILLVVLIAILPLIIVKGAEFGGADGQAEELINEINPNYKPWVNPFWEPPSGEIESLLFALQAAIGSGFIFYFIGYHKGMKKGQESEKCL